MFKKWFQKPKTPKGELIDTDMIGGKFEAFLRESYPLLDEHILTKIESEAWDTFKKIPADDVVGIIEAQMMSKIVDKIRAEIDRLIKRGQEARQRLKDSTLSDEEEEDL